MKLNTERVLCISDLHTPYQHPDALKFLAAIKKKYKPTLVISMGDETDGHALSFHDSDADLPSAGDELQAAQKVLQQLERLFPKMLIVDSNHGSLVFRRAKHHGIPLKFIAPLNDIYGVGKGWEWRNDITLKLKDGNEVYLCHGMVKDGKKFVMQRGQCIVQGHYHTDFRIDYVSTPDRLMWSMQVGCLIDKHALAFAYDRLNLNRPILGSGMIINGQPLLIPMIVGKGGKWTGKLP